MIIPIVSVGAPLALDIKAFTFWNDFYCLKITFEKSHKKKSEKSIEVKNMSK